MSNETEYQGWANYETWAVNLWLSDSQSESARWDNIAQDNRSRSTLADLLKEDYQDKMPQLPYVWGDLIGAALSEVDWYQVAEALLEDYVPEEGETSSGSCLLEDIVEGIKDLLPEDMFDEFELYDPDDTDDDDARNGIFEEICEYLNEIAPEGLEFGASEGDGASFGFWKIEDDETEIVRGPIAPPGATAQEIRDTADDWIPEELAARFDTETDQVKQSQIFEEIISHLNDIAPEGLRFGAHEHEGKPVFGFWQEE